MEYFEKKAFHTAPTPQGIGLGLWMTLLSPTQQEAHKQLFPEHINNIDPSTKVYSRR